jgi:hypothetical protein
MKQLLGIFIGLSLISCGTKHASVVSIDDATQPYVSEFQDVGASQGRSIVITDLIVQFGETNVKANEIGKCTVGTDMTPTVTLSKPFWDSVSNLDRRELVFHELGHCLLGLAHDDRMVAGPLGLMPKSIMHTQHLGPALYNQTTESWYETDLFGNDGIRFYFKKLFSSHASQPIYSM